MSRLVSTVVCPVASVAHLRNTYRRLYLLVMLVKGVCHPASIIHYTLMLLPPYYTVFFFFCAERELLYFFELARNKEQYEICRMFAAVLQLVCFRHPSPSLIPRLPLHTRHQKKCHCVHREEPGNEAIVSSPPTQ